MKKKLILVLLLLILLLSAFLRLYRISDYMTFLGDEGRDVMVAKGILEGNFTLLGPRASAGDFFLGPVYYYMIAPFLWLFRMDPVGPSVMVGLLGVATVFLLYFVGKRFFSEKAGLFAAALYAVSPLVITYSHSSWNPNVLPFFALLTIYTTFKSVAKARSFKYLFLTGLLLGIILQLHYLALFLAITVVFYIFFAEWYLYQKIPIFRTAKHYLFIILGFTLGFLPFLAFEARHGFPNIKTIFNFILTDIFHPTVEQHFETHASFFATVGDVFFRIFARLVFDFPTPDRYHLFPLLTLQLWGLAIVIIALASIVGLYFQKNKFIVMLLYIWLFVGVFLFGFYKKSIYDYYFAFLFPLPFLLIGNLLSRIIGFAKNKNQQVILGGIVVVFFLAIFISNLLDNPFKNIPNRQKNQTKTIAEFVISKTNNKPFNFALLSPGNSDHGYRYYLEIEGHKPMTIENTINDPQRKSVTSQLLIVCEDIGCKPLGNSLFEVAGFGRAKIAGVWDVSVVKVYRLVHYTGK